MSFILINKLPGPTSHDIIDQLRRITGIKKIGHAGTLDPFAEGLLLVAIGREATREISQFVGLDKEYVATLKLGATSDTYDKTGNIKNNIVETHCNASLQNIEEILKQFVGEIEQIPPMFSAKKVNGQKLYELARQGKEIDRKPCPINIYNITLNQLPITDYQLQITISCSSGTYIRSLAQDIGQALGCGAYLEKLVRTKIGDYKLANAVSVDKLNQSNWLDFCFEK